MGKVFRKAFRILGLDERKSRCVVEQDFQGNFQVNQGCQKKVAGDENRCLLG